MVTLIYGENSNPQNRFRILSFIALLSALGERKLKDGAKKRDAIQLWHLVDCQRVGAARSAYFSMPRSALTLLLRTVSRIMALFFRMVSGVL